MYPLDLDVIEDELLFVEFLERRRGVYLKSDPAGGAWLYRRVSESAASSQDVKVREPSNSVSRFLLVGENARALKSEVLSSGCSKYRHRYTLPSLTNAVPKPSLIPSGRICGHFPLRCMTSTAVLI